MIVKKNGEKIEISFKYTPALVSFVKGLEGRKYSPLTKSWFIPLAGSSVSIEQLERKGFTIDPALLEAVKQDQKVAQEAEAIAVMDDAEFSCSLPLYPFQRAVTAFMVKTGSCLNACGVRTGKTIMALASVEKNGTKRNLVIVPGSVLFQWQDECRRFLPQYKTFVVVGNAKQRRIIYKEVQECIDPFFLILSYDVARVDKEILVNEMG